MFLYAYIFLLASCSLALAQADSSLIGSDSIGSYKAVQVIIKGDRTQDALTSWQPFAASADLRNAEKVSATSTLSEILPLLHSSFDVRSYGTLGGISLPSFRGLAPEYVSVYKNGIRLTNAQNSLTDLERYTSRASSSVSILSSAQSLWVAGDIAGAVVNISSSRPLSDEYSTGVSFATYDEGASLNEKDFFFRGAQLIDGSSVKLLANYRVTDGAYPFYQRSDGSYINRSNNDAYLATIEVEPYISLSDGSYLSPLLSFSEAERGVPGAAVIDGQGASSPLARQYDKDWLAALAYKSNISEVFSHQASLSYQSQYETYADPTKSIDDEYRNNIAAAAYRAAVTFGSMRLMSSLEFDRNLLESNQHASDKDIKRDRYSLSASGKYSFSDEFSIIGTARVEKLSDVESLQFLPAGSFTYSPLPTWGITASASKFFHAPTFNQLYWSVGGNPDLAPEYGESYELKSSNVLVSADSFVISLQTSLFQTDIRDQIIWTPGKDGIWSPINLQRVRVLGVELNSEFQIKVSARDVFNLRLGGTYLPTLNLTPSTYFENELPYSTRVRIISTARYEVGGIGSAVASFSYRSQRFTDLANNSSGILPPVFTTDIFLRSAPIFFAGMTCEPQLSVINISNAQYEEVLNFPLPGRIFKLSLDFTYKPKHHE